MRSFERVLRKTNESRFFLMELGESWDDDKSNYLFSAFASAARSITFTLQAVCARVPGFKEWYAARRAELADDELARFLLAARNQVQKLGLAPLGYRGSALERTVDARHYCRRRYRFVTLEGHVSPPTGEAVTLCRRHLVNLARVVADCYADFLLDFLPWP